MAATGQVPGLERWNIANRREEDSRAIHLELLILEISSKITPLNNHSSRIGSSVTEIIKSGSEKLAISMKMFSSARRGPNKLIKMVPISICTKQVMIPKIRDKQTTRIHLFLLAFFALSIQKFGFSDLIQYGLSMRSFPTIIPSIMPGIEILIKSIQNNY